jgi:hypothetical protein
MKKFLRALDFDKVTINWNKNPIPMNLFLSFLTVEVERKTDGLGSSNGWTKLVGEDGLIIGGGIIKGVEYLDRLKYGERLDNPYNNHVNPFYMFGILNQEGRKFFVEYYKDDIQAILSKADERLSNAQEYKEEVSTFWGKWL